MKCLSLLLDRVKKVFHRQTFLFENYTCYSSYHINWIRLQNLPFVKESKQMLSKHTILTKYQLYNTILSYFVYDTYILLKFIVIFENGYLQLYVKFKVFQDFVISQFNYQWQIIFVALTGFTSTINFCMFNVQSQISLCSSCPK